MTPVSLVDTLKANLRQGGIFIAFVLCRYSSGPTRHLHSRPGNLTSSPYSPSLILAIGMLLSSGPDRHSVGSVVAVTGTFQWRSSSSRATPGGWASSPPVMGDRCIPGLLGRLVGIPGLTCVDEA